MYYIKVIVFKGLSIRRGLSEEWIVFLFVADGGRMSMSRIYLGIFGQDEQVATDAFAELVEVSSGKVGSTDASLEKHIPAEDTILLPAIIYHATR